MCGGLLARRFAWAALLGAIGLATFNSGSLWAADHRDGPRVTANTAMLGALDLNDFYVFTSPSNRNNSVFILTTGGAGVGILSPPVFFPGGVYEFRLSNDGNDLTDELVIQVVFSNPDSFMRQAYMVIALDTATGHQTILASGVTGRDVPLRGGGKVRAGLFDDPFFFDSLAFNKFKAAVEAGKPLADRVAPFLPPNIPNNFFGNFNVLAIVLEVPRLRVQRSRSQPNISVWIRTLLPDGQQFDREGNPAINTAVNFEQPLQGLANVQDLFNSIGPSTDPSLRGAAAQRINLAYGLPIDKATALATMLLPDVVHFNTTVTSGFLNGRRLEDDVIDAELNLLTGGALTSDRVINDSVFSNRFPYLGSALPRAATRSAFEALQKLNEPSR